MKRQIRFLMFLAAAVFSLTAMADDAIDNTFQFVDEEGNVIDNGSTIVRTEITDNGFADPFISSGLYVKNTTDELVGVGMELTISQIDNGELSFCFPSTCVRYTAITTVTSGNDCFEANELRSLQTEWTPTAYGDCVATFKLMVMDCEFDSYGLPQSYTLKAYGPEVTVDFSYPDPAGINGVKVSSNSSDVVARYTLQGQRISAPQKGVNIVKYADGTTIKTLIK